MRPQRTGPIASQDWFVANLNRVLKFVPLNKIICAVGNYGYDWEMSIPDPKAAIPKLRKPHVVDTKSSHVSDVWQRPAMPMPTSISITTPSILTSSTSTKTPTHATSSGSSMA